MLDNIRSNGAEGVFNHMYNSNPNFKQFVDENKGLSEEDIAKKYGIPIR